LRFLYLFAPARRGRHFRRQKMNRTSLTVAVVATIAVIASAPETAHAQRVGKYKSSGAYATASGTDASGCRFFYIWVGRGGTTASPQTSLYVDSYDSCSGSWSWASGTIANADFKTGTKSATLKTNGASSTSLSTQGETLAISLTFTKSSAFSYSWSGHSRTEYYGHVVQRHGSNSYSSASVSGTIGGAAVNVSWAETGTGREHYIEFDRGQK
jgi:hypothetical protein